MTQKNLFDADALWNVPRVGKPEVAPDGSFFVYPATVYPHDGPPCSRLWLVETPQDTATCGTPLTADGSSSTHPRVSPDGSKLAFVRTPPGDDTKPQLYLLPLGGGEAKKLTDCPLGAGAANWLPDGSGLVFPSPIHRSNGTLEGTREWLAAQAKQTSSARVTENRLYRFWDRWLTDDTFTHLFHLDLETLACRDLTPAEWRQFPFMEAEGSWSVDPLGEEVAFTATVTEEPYDRLQFGIFTVNLSTGDVRCLTPDNTASARRPRYTPDGRYLIYGAQSDWQFYADRVRLMRFDRTRGEHVDLTEDWDYSAGEFECDPGNDELTVLAEDRGRTSAFSIPIGGGTPRLLATGGTWGGLTVSRDGLHLVAASLTAPPEIHQLSRETGSLTARTHATQESMASVAIGEVMEVQVPGADGVAVQCWLVHPPDFDPSRRWPLVHLIHGGPHGVLGDSFNFRWNAQVFASWGYVVAMVNFHGSTSFGQEYAQCIQGAWGDRPTRDILGATDAIIERGYIDEARMAITGGSYGGYLTAWLTTQTDRFRCAVCHAGVTDLGGMFAGDITQGWPRAFGGAPYADREGLDRWSPVHQSQAMNTPTLVIHGELDYRVPVTQGLELYGILKAKGIPARLVYYPDENHWILKRGNSSHWYGEVRSWLDRHLSDPAESAAKS